jgi:hypothetical protein
MDDMAVFCRQVWARSDELRRALRMAHHGGLTGQVLSTLRQQLDSMVRVLFLLAQEDRDYRGQLIRASVNGERWVAHGTNRPITDAEMVELAQRLHGWAASVYKFGCAFIHLSSLHDYRDRDPMDALPRDEKDAILAHLRHYHGGPRHDNPRFDELVPFLPGVFDKIESNLDHYLNDLRRDRDLD